MNSVLPVFGQSNYDICLQVYGSLDNLVKLCIDNNITDINTVQNKKYIYDENSVLNKNYTGYQYGTDII